MKNQELIERAKYYIITTAAVPDCATQLAEINLRYGLAKIHYVQESLGYSPDASFIASPDMTTLRYPLKWKWGLGAGGILSWGNGNCPLVFLDLQVSTSTALIGGLNEEPEWKEITAQIHQVRQNRPIIKGLEVGWGFGSGNHFINAYRVHHIANISLSPYVFILHGGDNDVQRPSILGMGLNYEKSKPLRDLISDIDTPLGPVKVLVDQAAYDYYAMYLQYAEFYKEKQMAIGAEIFGDFTPISNEIHHGFSNMNSALLGCYQFDPDQRTIFPLTLRSDLPAYLVWGQPNFDPKILPCNHLPDTVRTQVHNANILPHGGGYTYREVNNVIEVLVYDERRYYVLDNANGGKRIVENLGTLIPTHRGDEVMEQVQKYHLADIVAELQPLFSITT